ncbi:MAG: PAS domain-containing protein [Burkholderiales bacterium]|nr:PAS domain-containing protein [Burkholderiales bacterium]
MRWRTSVPWLVLAAALALTAGVATWMESAERSAGQHAFEQLVARKMRDLDAALDRFEIVLRGTGALFISKASVGQGEWSAYIGSLGLRDRRDSFVAFGYAPLVVPSGATPRAQVAVLETLRAPARVALGDDLLADPAQREAIERALRSRRVALSARIDGVPGPRGEGPGAMMLLPLTRSGRVEGLVFLQFRVDEMTADLVRDEFGGISLKVAEVDGGTVLFESARVAARVARHVAERQVEAGGRRWRLTFTSTPALEERLSTRVPETVLALGTLGALLFFLLLRATARTRRRAEEIAERSTAALSDQVRLTEDLIESNPNPIFRTDAAGNFAQFNLAWERMTGVQRAAWIGRPATDLFDALQAQVYRDQDAALLHDRESGARIETVLHRADGTTYDVVVNKAAMRRADGAVAGILGTITDVTETKRLIAQNEAQREQLALVNQSAQAGVWDIQWPDGNAYFSPRYYEMLGYAPGDAGGLPGARSELVHPEDRARVEAAREAHFSGAQPYFDCEYRLRRADGSYLWVSGRGLASLDGDGRPVRFTGSILDITQRRVAQLGLERQREQLELVIESVQAGVWDDDLVTGQVYYSQRYREIMGYAPDEDMDAHARDPERDHAEDRAAVHAARAAAIRDGAPYDLEYRMRRKDGTWVWVNARAKASYDAAGFAVRFTGAIIDIGARKAAEFALRDANQRALDAAQVKSTFLATMSHEIRTPLNGVIGSAGLLADTVLNAEQRDYVETIRLSGVQLLTLIDDILDFSKIESGRMDLEDVPFEVATVIEEAFDLVAERARAKGLELVYELGAELPARVYGDVTRVRQVLLNLIGNAVKFTATGEIHVVCSGQGAAAGVDDDSCTLSFAVHDSGIGIAEDKLARLFTPFTQVDTSTTRQYGGTGLGLAISQRLASLMGGAITVASEVGRGSTFTFSMRTRRAPAGAGDRRRAGEIGLIAGRRALIVEDNASLARALAAACERWGLWTVGVTTADEALDAVAAAHAARTPFDVVICDLLHGDRDAIHLAREMAVHRKLNRVRLPVIIVSPRPRSEVVEGREVPDHWIAAFLTKPLRQAQLFNALLDALAPERPFHLAGPESVPPPERVQAYSGALRILLAEDNEINRKIALRMLERHGKTATTVDNGLRAVEAALTGDYDCILMDVQMPELDGLEATRRILAALPEMRRPYIIAMTANAMSGDREICLAAGMHDYIAKPVQMQVLSAALTRAAQFLARRDTDAAAVPAPAGVAAASAATAADQVLDMAQVDELIGLDDTRAVLGEFIELYTTQGPQRIEEIAAAAAADDFERLARVAHSLKGASANLGAVGVAELARRLEVAGHARDAEGMEGLIAGIRDEYRAAEAALRTLQAEPA